MEHRIFFQAKDQLILLIVAFGPIKTPLLQGAGLSSTHGNMYSRAAETDNIVVI